MGQERPGMGQSFGQTQERDFPYFRRLWNSIVVALIAASFIPLIVIGGGMYYYTLSLLERRLWMPSRMRSTSTGSHRCISQQENKELKLLSSNLDRLSRLAGGLQRFESMQRGEVLHRSGCHR
jgi:hypothetical protein